MSVYSYKLLSERWPVARKEHWCTECHRAIMPRVRYHRIVYIGEEHFWCDKLHLQCAGEKR